MMRVNATKEVLGTMSRKERVELLSVVGELTDTGDTKGSGFL
jgi:hypothetical protein